jgi:hypothetical protein
MSDELVQRLRILLAVIGCPADPYRKQQRLCDGYPIFVIYRLYDIYISISALSSLWSIVFPTIEFSSCHIQCW